MNASRKNSVNSPKRGKRAHRRPLGRPLCASGKSMRRLFLILCLATAGYAQGTAEKFNHVQWTATAEPAEAAPGATVLVRLEANVDAEWHMYSLTTPPGPIPTTIRLVDGAAVDEVVYFEPPAVTKFDPNFNANTETYEGKQVFLAR